MAETCIVCLGDLVPHEGSQPPPTDAALSLATHDGAETERHPDHVQHVAPTPAELAAKDGGLVAHLLPCGHNLHDECLKPWVERANSCPICRANFNMVELSTRIGGPILSSYSVKDKQQVAELDLSMIVEDEPVFEDDGSYDACMVCDEFGESSTLMYCHSCEQLCHVFCAGLDEMPTRGAWYCQGCIQTPTLLEAAARRSSPRGPAAYFGGRSRLPRRQRGGPDEWVGVWQSVWNRLHFDIEFPFEEDEESETRSEIQRRENQEWERRFELARQMGAGTRFRAAADNVHTHRLSHGSRARPTNPALHRDPPKTPKDPESQEELRAWNAFEKAREQVAEAAESVPAETTNPRRRKRKSVDSSPAEPEPQEAQPERKLKRPRTRLNVNVDVPESSAAAARRNTVANASSPPAGVQNGGIAPGFLHSILQEVAVDRFAQHDQEIAAPQPKRVIIERAMSPHDSSPGLSPVYSSPRQGMSTPPPLNINRTDSPAQDQKHSPTYSPYSPGDNDARKGRRKLAHRPHSPGLSSPSRSKDSSPTRSSLSYSTKAELQRMVSAVLKPIYMKKDITKDEYTEINRDVSRLLYERVGDAGANALMSQDTRGKWQKMALDEVNSAVLLLPSSGAASAGEDSASS